MIGYSNYEQITKPQAHSIKLFWHSTLSSLYQSIGGTNRYVQAARGLKKTADAGATYPRIKIEGLSRLVEKTQRTLLSWCPETSQTLFPTLGNELRCTFEMVFNNGYRADRRSSPKYAPKAVRPDPKNPALSGPDDRY